MTEEKPQISFKTSAIFAVFLFLITVVVNIILSLIPEDYKYFIVFTFLIFAYLIYDNYLVGVFGLNEVWWLPHRKKLIITGIKEEVIPAELLIIDFIEQNGYNSYTKTFIKGGYKIIGIKKGMFGLKLISTFIKDTLHITFYPLISKKTVDEMKKFEKFVENYEP